MREVGVVMSGVLAVASAVVGVFSLAQTGLVWYEGGLRETSGFDPMEASLGWGGLVLFWAIAAVLVILAIAVSARRAVTQPDDRRMFVALSTLIPLVVVAATAFAWFVLLARVTRA